MSRAFVLSVSIRVARPHCSRRPAPASKRPQPRGCCSLLSPRGSPMEPSRFVNKGPRLAAANAQEKRALQVQLCADYPRVGARPQARRLTLRNGSFCSLAVVAEDHFRPCLRYLKATSWPVDLAPRLSAQRTRCQRTRRWMETVQLSTCTLHVRTREQRCLFLTDPSLTLSSK